MQVLYPMLKKTGLSSSSALRKASSPQGYQSTGFPRAGGDTGLSDFSDGFSTFHLAVLNRLIRLFPFSVKRRPRQGRGHSPRGSVGGGDWRQTPAIPVPTGGRSSRVRKDISACVSPHTRRPLPYAVHAASSQPVFFSDSIGLTGKFIPAGRGRPSLLCRRQIVPIRGLPYVPPPKGGGRVG